MHSFWFGWKAIGDSAASSHPDVDALGAANGAIMRFFALAIVGELIADSAGEYLATIENGNPSPTSSRRAQKPVPHAAKISELVPVSPRRGKEREPVS